MPDEQKEEPREHIQIDIRPSRLRCELARGGVLAMEAIWLLAILACPLVMGVMMFLMMRGMRRDHRAAGRADEETR